MAEAKQQRIIGRWTIGSTLGKGGYSWVKRGQDIKTGKIVALKFMEKADVSWVKEQAKQVETEIEALKNIRHQNVMKLYAYNLNAQYPLAKGQDAAADTHGQGTKVQASKDQKFIDTILLVLEYAPGGELFDILYYTSSLKEDVARTYFKQIINGLEACHNANVVHRDLKPQNLLLDSKYNLKITDFGLSKIIQSDADAIMKTTYVGTRGYQAPELLLNQKYDLKCDVFSVGVILFILLAGYPPFEQASKSDKWFKPLMQGKIDKFWKAHAKSPICKNNMKAKDLLTKMLCFDPKQRIDMNGIKKHEWLQGPILKQKELIAEIRDRHRKAEKKRRQDVRKMEDLAQSININKPIPGIEKAKLKLFPEDQEECMFGEVYTYADTTKGQKWYDLLNLIEEQVTAQGGSADFDFDTNTLSCTMNVAGGAAEEKEQAVAKSVSFDVQMFESRVWKDVYLTAEKKYENSKKGNVPGAEEILESGTQEIFLVRTTRTGGDTLLFQKIKNTFLLQKCSTYLKGLPQWAQEVEKAQEEEEEEAKKNAQAAVQDEVDNKEADEEDVDYDKLLAEDDPFKQQPMVAVQ